MLHIHRWKHNPEAHCWTCPLCAEVITEAEFKREYGYDGDPETPPHVDLNRLVCIRKGPVKRRTFKGEA